ncbi:uncharacterized protein LOC126633878 [Malus sylvestris]|uniref:uncharacterized protein LOC126633878 n=1 Tax=Malus sylvestris TaxID=3752 RepID=UPI0021AC7E8A|nr:uncharacterized protein LOC126633878 [Malus sylvestris]
MYSEGVENFLNYAMLHATDINYIRCPCLKCGNIKSRTVKEIREDLFFNGIDQSYCTWYWHGEAVPDSKNEKMSNREEIVEDNIIGMVEAAYDHFASNPKQFEKLLEDAEKPVYPGSNFTKLSTLVRLYNIKAKNGCSDKLFADLLEFLGVLLPQKNEIPPSVYEAKKTLFSLGIEYEKIHACPNDCILYRKEHLDAIACPTCGFSRWKVNKSSREPSKGVPAKVLWYFPPIPRFQRMFYNRKTAKNLIWHAQDREVDGKLRHPADSPSWKLVDHMWPEFGDDPRNLQLAISTDGINPHSALSSRYSCWPVIMVTYNLPPWLCMKRKFMMLTLLISGPKQPGNDIDVYMAPLIDDLKTLWEIGVETYDAYNKENFMLRAVLLWTINDFPAYGNLCGCSVKGYSGCPICGDRTSSKWLKLGRKVIFTGHRRFLPQNHHYRQQKKPFDGTQEFGLAPSPLSGEEILHEVEGIKISWGKKNVNLLGKRKVRSGTKAKVIDKKADAQTRWKKKSIFFDLPYWKSLHVRHCLDVMHIEKNVCESIYGTLLNIPGKTKDGVAARNDLIALGLRTDLAPKHGNNKTFLPPAPYTLSKAEKISVCKALSELKVPSGYSSNFRNLVSMEELKLFNLKSHDCHILMQQLLPVALRAVLPKHVRYAITRFCLFFSHLCSKTVDVLRLDEIQSELVITLCLLEKIFPPSFFDIMVHLTVHLVREVRLCGPVYFRWMYPFERYMKILKGYVRNKYRPEGCMVECYIAEEAIEVCSEYLSGVDPIGIPLKIRSHHKDVGHPLSAGKFLKADKKYWQQAHHYVLDNTLEVEPYIKEHKKSLIKEHPKKSKNLKWLQDEHNRTFIYWLQKKVEDELNVPNNHISETLRWIAHGPRDEVTKYSGYSVNGCNFHTKSRDDSQVTQNSGVSLVANTMQISSAKDKNPIIVDMTFYGVIQEIWELNYNAFTRVVFKCDWVENKSGIRLEEFGIKLIDLNKIGHKSDSFVLATQVKQIFYIADPEDSRWSVVLPGPQYDWLHDDELGDTIIECECLTTKLPPVESFDVLTEESDDIYMRDDCEGIWVENT